MFSDKDMLSDPNILHFQVEWIFNISMHPDINVVGTPRVINFVSWQRYCKSSKGFKKHSSTHLMNLIFGVFCIRLDWNVGVIRWWIITAISFIFCVYIRDRITDWYYRLWKEDALELDKRGQWHSCHLAPFLGEFICDSSVWNNSDLLYETAAGVWRSPTG